MDGDEGLKVMVVAGGPKLDGISSCGINARGNRVGIGGGGGIIGELKQEE